MVQASQQATATIRIGERGEHRRRGTQGAGAAEADLDQRSLKPRINQSDRQNQRIRQYGSLTRTSASDNHRASLAYVTSQPYLRHTARGGHGAISFEFCRLVCLCGVSSRPCIVLPAATHGCSAAVRPDL